MARFNGTTAQHSGHAGTRADADVDGAVWTPEQVARWHQEQALLHQQANPLARAPVPRGASGAGQAGYNQQYAPAHDPHAPPYPGTQHGSAPDPYAPAPESWRPQAGWSTPPPLDAHQGYAHQHGSDRFSPQPPAPVYPDPAASRGYDPQFADFSGRQPGHGHQDGQSWDLGGYPPAHQPNAGFNGAPGHPSSHAPYAHADAQHWSTAPGAAPAHGQQHYADPGFELGGRGQNGGYQPSKFQFDPSDTQNDHGHDYAEPAEEEEPRRRGASMFVIAGALIGAIVLGGGLAYGYKQFTSTASTEKAPPVVKADKSAAKAKPSNPGGKDVAHTDKKFLNQLAEPPPAETASSEPDAGAGPRKVSTMVVARDGSVSQPLPVNVAPAPIAPSPSGVPGMIVDSGPRPMLRGPAPATEPSPAIPSVAETEPRTVPRVSEMALPRVRPEPQRVPAAADTVQPAAKAPAVKKSAATRDDAAFAGATPAAVSAAPAAAPAPRAASAGFVTVLASRKSREEAFSMYPDLQVKYADILSDKVPDVRETDLRAQNKGIMFRLVLGPPGSKEAAIDTCNKLKAQGFSGCWATPY